MPLLLWLVILLLVIGLIAFFVKAYIEPRIYDVAIKIIIIFAIVLALLGLLQLFGVTVPNFRKP